MKINYVNIYLKQLEKRTENKPSIAEVKKLNNNKNTILIKEIEYKCINELQESLTSQKLNFRNGQSVFVF